MAYVGFVVIRLKAIDIVKGTNALGDPRLVVPEMFILASGYMWTGWLFGWATKFFLKEKGRSILLITSFLVCALVTGIILNATDIKLVKANTKELYALKASFCVAALGFAMGELGIDCLFQTIAGRKQVMQFASKRCFSSNLGCGLGAAWACIGIVNLKSTLWAVFPLLILATLYLFVVLTFLRH